MKLLVTEYLTSIFNHNLMNLLVDGYSMLITVIKCLVENDVKTYCTLARFN